MLIWMLSEYKLLSLLIIWILLGLKMGKPKSKHKILFNKPATNMTITDQHQLHTAG